MNRIKTTLLIVLIASLLAACQKRAKQSETLQSKNFDAERSTFFHSLATPGEAARQLQAITAEFHSELMNDPKMFSHYAANEVRAAANLGVYMSDLNYSIAYAQSTLTTEYFEASYELGKAAGIEKRVLEFLKARYEKNLAKNDSVAAVVNDLLSRSTRDLQGTEKERLAGIAMAAYQIENLHLALGLFQRYSKDSARAAALTPLFKMIVSQRGNVEIIYNFLKIYSDPLDPDKNPNYPYYTNAFNELLATYKKPMPVDAGTEWMNGVIGELAVNVNAIRSKIISVE